jgi:DNA repair exonuclease SbcCD nuclease subunit
MSSTININNKKAAIISDLHLGIHTNSSFWHNIAIEWANWFASQLRQQDIKDIIFCGDWHHNRSEISVNTLQVSADILDIFSDFNLIMIAGNHDMYFKYRTDVNSLSIFKSRKNISIIDNITRIKAFDRIISFCPWSCDINNITKSDVVFGHFEIETFAMNSYKVCTEGTKISDILPKSPLIISGHFHTRHKKEYNTGTILYVGNPFQMDFGDINNDKGYYIIDFETLEYNFHKNDISPKYHKITLSDLVKAGNFTPDIKKCISNNIVNLKIDRNISHDDIDVLIKKITLLRPVELTVDYDINFNRLKSDVDIKEDLSGINIEQAIVEFVNLLETSNKQDIVNYTLELYRKSIV